MYNHAPKNYQCPICLGLQGIENDLTLIKQSDFIYKDKNVSILMSSFYIKNIKGLIIIVPNEHFENIFDISQEILSELTVQLKKISLILKKIYKCTGITILQNNEPDGGQHAFHFHFNVIPRYKDDELHTNMLNKKLLDPKERLIFTKKIKEAL